MPPRMTTRSAGRATAASRGERTGGRTGQTGRVMIGLMVKNIFPTIVAQVGNQGRGQGNGRNQNGDAVNDNIRGDVRNIIENNDRRGCTYTEFLTCNPKEYDGKVCAIVYTHWIKKIKSVQDMSGCRDNPKVKYTASLFVGKVGHAAYTDRFYMFARLVPHLVTPENKRIERNGSIKNNHEKRGNGREPNNNKNMRDDNKSTRTGNAFAITTNPVKRENT
nr:hypothetical protein [Tanacetum cinerariifolium]